MALYLRKPPLPKVLVGVDVFVHQRALSPQDVAALHKRAYTAQLPLEMITNRGVKVWPNGFSETFCTDHWRCRFGCQEGSFVDYQQVLNLLTALHRLGLDVIKTENVCTFAGERGFALGQGQ